MYHHTMMLLKVQEEVVVGVVKGLVICVSKLILLFISNNVPENNTFLCMIFFLLQIMKIRFYD